MIPNLKSQEYHLNQKACGYILHLLIICISKNQNALLPKKNQNAHKKIESIIYNLTKKNINSWESFFFILSLWPSKLREASEVAQSWNRSGTKSKSLSHNSQSQRQRKRNPSNGISCHCLLQKRKNTSTFHVTDTYYL